MDIEDRYYATEFVKNSLMLSISRKCIDKQIEDATDPDKRLWLNKVKKQIKMKILENKDHRPLASVEYRPLSSKGKKTFQGMLEMFVEVFDSKTAKLVPVSKIPKPVPEKYELRLII